jgi:ATP-binding cassette, subfamily C (CFTR/MRP), member 1
LDKAQLRSYINASLGGTLDAGVVSSGDNLSAGQKQLLCLARAMLTRSRIIVLDEATASVDLHTDAVLQQALCTYFADCTVLTIAHRLNTIIDYDRVMVLDGGRVAEFDSPKQLLSRPESIFTALVDETGPVNAAWLRTMAR